MTGPRNQHGFTLQELMISIAILFIVTAIGIPGYISYVRNGSRDNTVTDLFSNMYYARSEAIKLNTNVSMCRTGDTTAAAPVCGGTAKDWTSGWLIFVDSNKDGALDNGEKLLKIGSPIKNKNGIQIKSNATADPSISFLNDGSLKIAAGGSAIFGICDNRDGTYNPSYGRYITITPMGRPEITTIPNGSSCSP